MLGGQRLGDSRFSSGPRQVLGRSPPAPRSLSSLGAVCTRLCFLSRRPLSRCGLLGKGACVAACDKESGLAGGGAGAGGGRSQVCLTLSQQTGVFRTTVRSTAFLSEERQARSQSKALSLQPLYLPQTVPLPGPLLKGAGALQGPERS